MDFKDRVIHDFPNLPDWKLHLWNKISKEAKPKGAFPLEHFNGLGLIRPYIRQYHGLYDWLAGCEDEAKYESLEPIWEYRGRNEWELFFISTEDWLHVKPLNDEEAIALKPWGRHKLGRGGMVVKGLEPKNGFADDFEMIDKLEAMT